MDVSFLLPCVALVLIIIGFLFTEYISMIFGGMLLFLYGFDLMNNPLASITFFQNTALALIVFGFGIYVWFRASFVAIENMDIA